MADFENNDVVRLGAVLKLENTNTIVNTWTFQITSGGPLPFVTASLDFQEYVEALYRPLVTNYSIETDSDRISVKNLTQDTVWGAISWNPSFTGTNVGQMTAPQVALLGWGRTPLSRVQLRKYFGPFTEGDINDGRWLSGIRATIQNIMDYHIGSQTMTQGLVLQGVAYNIALSRATTAVTATTGEVAVIQRRRRWGRGA